MNNSYNNDYYSNQQDNQQPNQMGNGYQGMPPQGGMSNNVLHQMDNENLLREFIGNNYEKIRGGGFNFAAFFFGPFYLFYRKMILWGTILFAIDFVVSTIITVPFLSLFISVAIGALFNKFYVEYAKTEVESIRMSNPHNTLDACIKKGGTSVGSIFLGLIIQCGVDIVLIILSALLGIGMFKNYKRDIEELKKETFVGKFEYNESIKIDDQYTMSIPLDFENKSTSSFFDYYNDSQKENGVCEMTMGAVNNFYEANKYITKIYNYYEAQNGATEVKFEKINNVNWYWTLTTDEKGAVYYYATNNMGKVYLLTFTVNNNAIQECESYRKTIIDTIKAK